MPDTAIDLGRRLRRHRPDRLEAFAERVPHEWFAFLRKNAPVWWQEESDGPGFWAVTTHADCTKVNRDYEHFSSAQQGHLSSGTWPTTTWPSSS